jgi:ribonuclease P protein component
LTTVGLPASRRLKRHGDFARVKSGGAGQKGRFLVLNVVRTGVDEPWRCGLITSRKVGSAVDRNRIRRRLREIIRREGDRIARGLLLVIIARWNASEATMEDLQQDWSRCARRAGIYRESFVR